MKWFKTLACFHTDCYFSNNINLLLLSPSFIISHIFCYWEWKSAKFNWVNIIKIFAFCENFIINFSIPETKIWSDWNLSHVKYHTFLIDVVIQVFRNENYWSENIHRNVERFVLVFWSKIFIQFFHIVCSLIHVLSCF